MTLLPWIVLFLLTLFSYLWRRTARLRQAQNGFTSIPLSPATFTPVDVALIFSACLCKFLYSLLLPSSSPIRSLGDLPTGVSFRLPAVQVEAPWALGQRHKYFQTLIRDLTVTAGSSRDAASVSAKKSEKREGCQSSLFFPIAHSTPMLPLVFLQPNCPISPFGAVNTENHFEFLDPVACQSITDRSPDRDLRLRARLGGPELPGKRTERGLLFSVVIEVYEVESGKVLMRQTASILKFVGRQVKRQNQNQTPSGNGQGTAQTWKRSLHIRPSHVRQWAACTLDYNPIQVSYLCAKYLFGFPGIVAHGNLVLAAMFASLESAENTEGQSSGLEAITSGMDRLEGPVSVTVRFKWPVIVPTHLTACISNGGDEASPSWRFSIFCRERLHVEAELSLR